MRRTFALALEELAEADPRIVLVTGDLGFGVLESFASRFPARFFNAGVAEQNMVGMATGLADAGFLPFVYSIAPFATLRPYEFIRNGPVFQSLPVRIIGVGGGMEYGQLGPTHHSLEDVGIMRLQPGLTVVVPADYLQARSALLVTYRLPRPIYYRLGKEETAVINGLNGVFELGRLTVLREGPDLLLLAMGPVAGDVVGAAEDLAAQGVSSTVAVVSSFNPSPVTDLFELAAPMKLVITVEAHYATGGIGSLVAEVVADQGLGCRVIRLGVRESPGGLTGSQRHLHARHGLSREAVVSTALEASNLLSTGRSE